MRPKRLDAWSWAGVVVVAELPRVALPRRPPAWLSSTLVRIVVLFLDSSTTVDRLWSVLTVSSGGRRAAELPEITLEVWFARGGSRWSTMLAVRLAEPLGWALDTGDLEYSSSRQATASAGFGEATSRLVAC
jgi:hypothetical protein